MGILIGWAAKLVGERFAGLLVYATLLALLIGGIWWLRADAYDDGVAATDAKWEEAGRRLAEQAKASADQADADSAERAAEEFERVQDEKEKLDAAEQAGTSPLDVLFGSGG